MPSNDRFKFSVEKPPSVLSEISSLQSIFGDNSTVEYQPEQNSWSVKGILKDGINQGGQSISCTVKKSEITNKSGTTFYVWNMNDLSVNGQNISDFFEAPVYLFRPETLVDENDAWYSFVSQMDAGFDYDFHRIYLFAGLQNIDQLVSLLHENNHVVRAIDFQEVSHPMKMYRDFMKAVNQDLASGLNEDEVVEKGIKLLKDADIFDLVRVGAIETYREEVQVNNLVSDFFHDEQISGTIFKDEDAIIRLKKWLTVSSLSYAMTINKFFGQGTVDPKLAEIR